MFEKAHMAVALMQTCAALLDEVNRGSRLTLTVNNDVVNRSPVHGGYPFPTRAVVGRTVTIDVQYKRARSVERFPIS